MFTNKKTLKTVIYITKSKIKISSVDVLKVTENVIGEVNWTPQTLDGILLKLKKEIKGDARILISEDFVYTITTTFIGILLRENVRQKAQEFIPENLNETIWDFKEIAPAQLSGAPKLIQVVAVNKALFETLKNSIIKAELRIEAIEPVSFALARFTKKDTTSFYILIEDEILFVLSQYGVVLATEHITSLSVNAINQFIAFVKEKFNIDQKNVIFCGNTNGIDFNPFMNQSFKIEIQNVNPILSLAFKEDIKGKDEDILNLELLKLSSQTLQKKADSESPKPIPPAKKHKLSKTTLLAVFLLLAIGVLVVLILFKIYI